VTLLLLALLLQDDEVVRYKPEPTRPADFKEFWKKHLEALPKVDAKLEKVEKASAAGLTAYDLKSLSR
jgi:cephalosporin-C deacetylase-like acetyl esterase